MTQSPLPFVAWMLIVHFHAVEPAAALRRPAPTVFARSHTVEIAQPTKVAARSGEPPQDLGSIEGAVTYQPDPQRPWKPSRYYVRDPKQGQLAETVVALDGPSLAPSAPSAPPVSRTMDQVNFQFVPETMAIRAGDSVRITNSDEALHNVMTSDGGRPFNVNVSPGKEFTHTFASAGGLAHPIRLGCVFHGGMRAWIYVFDHPWFAVTERDGRFQFKNVPPGAYKLGVVHPAGKLRWSQRIEVKSNENTVVQIQLSPDHQVGSK